MDSGSTVADSRTRKEKLHKRRKANAGEDIISSKLPESLISHILSFLPTKDAVRTCVLSKEWMFRWTFITKLDIDESLFYPPKWKAQSFADFVNRVLLLTEGSCMESFSLVMANKHDVSVLNTWISNILKRGVKNLRIGSYFDLPFSALTSHYLFHSIFLEELVLETSCCACAIKVPNIDVYFGHLKLLKLRGIIFTFDSSRTYPGLSLPVLKKFVAKNCNWLGAKGVTVEAPQLESVFIEQDLKSVSHEPRSCAIKFSALHLKEFTYCGYGISQPIILSDPSSAHNASANIILNKCKSSVPATGAGALILLIQFSQVKCIKFVGSEVLTQQNVAFLPVFGMLSHLELGLVTCEVLLGLLLKSPVLNTLAFKGISKFDKELLNSAVVPDCLASTLQVVKFEKVYGYEHELILAKFVMENGMVMKRMSFSLASQWLFKSKVIEEFKEKLYSFKKGFSFAIVEFSYD